MARYRHIAFVCTNERDASDPRGSCKARGADALLDRLKELTHERGLKGQVRVVGAGCLNYCKKGCTVSVFSESGEAGGVEETWYTHVTPADADELFETHLVRGEKLERLVEPEKK